MTKRFFKGVPNSGPFKNLIWGQNPGSGVSGHTRPQTALAVAHGAPRRMRMGSAYGGAAQPFFNRASAVPQPCISRFSLAVSVGVPVGVSLPQINPIGPPGPECGLG